MVTLFINLVQTIRRIGCQRSHPSAPRPTPYLFLSFKASSVQRREINARRNMWPCLHPLELVRPWLDDKPECPGGWGSSAWSKHSGYCLIWSQKELNLSCQDHLRNIQSLTGAMNQGKKKKTNHRRWWYMPNSCVVLTSKWTNCWFLICFTPRHHDSSPHSPR